MKVFQSLVTVGAVGVRCLLYVKDEANPVPFAASLPTLVRNLV